jgi:multidrug resistance protein, MATE family
MENKLTKYPSGSIKELMTIAIPLMIASLSFHFMLFMDRFILAQYSLDDMNAAAVVGLMIFTISYVGITMAGIAEVFSGQAYGAKQFSEFSRPVWQMIWFSLFLIIPFYLVGRYLDWLFIDESLGETAKEYFRYWTVLTVIPSVNTALAAFYIARGRTKVVTLTTVFANVLNVILAYLFVGGVEGLLPPMGLMGTAYASTIAIFIQGVVLFTGLLLKDNRKKLGSLDYKFNWPIMKDCIKIGLPNSIGHLIEIAGWAVITNHLVSLGKDFVSINSIAQSMFIIVAFFADGMQKALTAIASNAIGAKRTETIKKSLISAIKLQVMAGCVFALPLLIFPTQTAKMFIASEADSYLVTLAIGALFGTWLYFLLDGSAWIVAAILTAGGDTKFLMVANGGLSWICAVIPTLYFITEASNPSTPWMITLPIYGAIILAVYLLRYRHGKWRHRLVHV